MIASYHVALTGKPNGEPVGIPASEFSQELSPAGAHLYQRYLVRPVIADLVASLAGIGANGRAA